MNKREQMLLRNEILIAAIYIDSTSRILLNDDQISKAKGMLYKIAIRNKQDDCTSNQDSASSNSNEDLTFEKYLHELSVKRRKLFNGKTQVELGKGLKRLFCR